uniref:Uncharacterized protein n=1 Tax=Avena sativa TaxID=4498 RepID=A0ACD5Z6I7_AVESA
MENTISDLAGLPCDLVNCIGSRLDVLARIRFRAVCRSWRAALPAGSVTWSFPLVVLPALPNRDLALPLDRSVVDSCGNTSSTSALALHIVVDPKRRSCVGSRGVWLAVADSESVIRLVNALTLQEAACLPPLPCPWVPGSTSRTSYNIRDHENVIHKVAFSVKPPSAPGSGSGYAHSAAALHRATTGKGDGLELLFTRARWDHQKRGKPTTRYRYPCCSMDGHFDVAYYQKSGVYYVVTPPGSVWVLDISAPVPTLEPLVRCHESLGEPTLSERRHLVVLPDPDNGGGHSLSKPMYLVMINDESEQPQQHRVVVHKYTAEESWRPVSHLRGRALLISTRAQSVLKLPTAASPPWLRPDCVYWMNGYENSSLRESLREGTSPVWRFHLPTKITQRFLRRQEQLEEDYYWLDWHNSLWLSTPSLTQLSCHPSSTCN